MRILLNVVRWGSCISNTRGSRIARSSHDACFLSTILLLALPALAHSEGSDNIGESQHLESSTVVYVDILDPGSESLTWSGVGTVTVHGPSNALLGTFGSGATISPTDGWGAYRFEMDSNQTTAWDFSATVGSSPLSGRTHSLAWFLDSGSYSETSAANFSAFALIRDGGGAPSHNVVIEVRLEGFGGSAYGLTAPATGLDILEGSSAPGFGFASLPDAGASVVPSAPLYLNPPESANYLALSPNLYSVSASVNGVTDPLVLVSSVDSMVIAFESDVTGSALLIVDVDADGQFDRSLELAAVGSVEPGSNQLIWDGMDYMGYPLTPGSYDARLLLVVGLLHFTAHDAESSFPGARMFQLDALGTRTPVSMCWNDVEVQYEAQIMPNGQYGLEVPGHLGMNSGDYSAPTVANVNARSWGNFTSSGKGNNAYINTYTWVDEDEDGFSFQIAEVSTSIFTTTIGAPFGSLSSYPNPFNPAAEIRYVVPGAGPIEITVHGPSGQLIAVLFDGFHRQGSFAMPWDGKNMRGEEVSSGVYFIRMQAGDFMATTKAILLR